MKRGWMWDNLIWTWGFNFTKYFHSELVDWNQTGLTLWSPPEQQERLSLQKHQKSPKQSSVLPVLWERNSSFSFQAVYNWQELVRDNEVQQSDFQAQLWPRLSKSNTNFPSEESQRILQTLFAWESPMKIAHAWAGQPGNGQKRNKLKKCSYLIPHLWKKVGRII